jgi:hypothetical protein
MVATAVTAAESAVTTAESTVATAESTVAAESAAEAPRHSAARETAVETRRGLERSALRGCEAPRRSSLMRSATEGLRAAVAWHCGPVPELGARPSALESVPARLAKRTMSGKRTVPSKSRKIRSRGR